MVIVCDRPDPEVLAAKSDVAVAVWTRKEADGVEGHLQLGRDSNEHARERLLVTRPLECEQDRIELLENNTKAKCQ